MATRSAGLVKTLIHDRGLTIPWARPKDEAINERHFEEAASLEISSEKPRYYVDVWLKTRSQYLISIAALEVESTPMF